MKTSLQITVRVDIESKDKKEIENIEDVINELDCDFYSTNKNIKIKDYEIVGWETL